AHLAIETDQKDVAHSILIKALRDEQAKDERYVDGDVGASFGELEKYGDLARRIPDNGLAKEMYSLSIAVALRNIRVGLLATYGYLTRIIKNDKAPELIDELVNGLMHIGAIGMAAHYCRMAATNETKRGNSQLADKLIEKAVELEKAETPLRM
ncbi:hypothetical protein HYX12_00500, partial [Candidatus Woesearchaeota archaeon]|nr:hypothetical protein [Candidatus Woesearchaeota archaeon]